MKVYVWVGVEHLSDSLAYLQLIFDFSRVLLFPANVFEIPENL